MIKELDLHKIKHKDVDRIVENFVLMNELPIRIITGNSEEMRRLVFNVLERHHMGYWSFKPSQITIMKR